MFCFSQLLWTRQPHLKKNYRIHENKFKMEGSQWRELEQRSRAVVNSGKQVVNKWGFHLPHKKEVLDLWSLFCLVLHFQLPWSAKKYKVMDKYNGINFPDWAYHLCFILTQIVKVRCDAYGPKEQLYLCPKTWGNQEVSFFFNGHNTTQTLFHVSGTPLCFQKGLP